MATRRFLAALIILLSPNAAFGEPSKTMELAWKFREGETLRYRVRYLSETAIKAGPGVARSDEPDPDLDVTLAWTVMKVGGDGTAEIRQTIEHVREELSEKPPAEQRLVYDSLDPRSIDNPWSGLKSEFYEPIIGSPYLLKIDRRGTVVDVHLPDDALKGWKRASLRPSEGRDFLFTIEGVKDLLSTMPTLPGREVAGGGRWRSDRQMTEGPFRKTLSETYFRSGQDGSVTTFEAKPELGLEIVPDSVPGRNRTTESGRRLSLTSATIARQSGKSKLSFDQAMGRVVSFSRRLDYELKYSFKGRSDGDKERYVNKTTVLKSEVNLLRALSTR